MACKAVNDVPIGSYWNKVLRIGPNPKAKAPPSAPTWRCTSCPCSCQHCDNPACVSVCPTEASHKLADGTVQIDKEKCIGCQFCAMACPYGVRYLNEEERVVEKCTLCEQKTAQGRAAPVRGPVRRPRPLLRRSGGRHTIALWPPAVCWSTMPSYDDCAQCPREDGESACVPSATGEVHRLQDVGNKPSCAYILREMTWQG